MTILYHFILGLLVNFEIKELVIAGYMNVEIKL